MGKQLVKIIKEICQENGYKFKSYSDDYIVQIDDNEKTMYVYGNKFPNNNASIEQICNDKAALSDLLQYYNIPHIPHYYFYTIDKSPTSITEETWCEMHNLLDECKILVCKNNKGTGGRNIYKVTDFDKLKNAVEYIISETGSVSLCPFIDVKEEYRVLILNNKVEYIFRKVRPVVIGDGNSTVKDLMKEIDVHNKIIISEEVDLEYVPKQNETILLNWKHNLGQGSIPELIVDEQLVQKLGELAEKCASKLDLQFVSIDIIDDGDFRILEINSGVMIEAFSDFSKEYYNLSKNAVSKAIKSYLSKL